MNRLPLLCDSRDVETEAALSVVARAPGSSGMRATIALAVTEARELILHPVFLAGGCLGVLFVTIAALGFGESNAGTDETQMLSFVGGFTCLPLGIGTFMAAHLGASRPERSRARDLFDPTPLSTGARTSASLLSVFAPAAIAAAVVAVSCTAIGSWDGLSVEMVGGRRLVSPSAAELAQGPAIVLFFGVAGVAIARWVRHPAVWIVVLGLMAPQMIAVSWLLPGDLWWLAPMANALVVADWVEVSSAYSYPVLESIALRALGWHLLYLSGLIALAAGLALVRSSARRAGAIATLAAVAVAVTAGVIQIKAL